MEEEKPSIEEELEALLAKLGGVDQELRGVTLMMEKSVRVLTSFFSRRIDELTAQREALRDELAGLASAHRAELLVGNKKIVKLRSGTIRWKFTATKVEIEPGVDEKTILKRIARLGGLRRYTRLGKRTLNKQALGDSPGFVARVRGLRRTRRENFIIQLTTTQAEIIKEGDPLVVRGEPTERED